MRYEEDKIFGAYMDSLLVEKKKGLPPWLKGKGKKMVKENMNDENIVGSDEDGCSIEDMRLAISETLNDLDEDRVREIYNMIMMTGDDKEAGGIDYVKNMETSEPDATAPSADRSTGRYMQ